MPKRGPFQNTGHMDRHEKAAKALVEGFSEVRCVRSILAYGSFARGDYGANSDIDLAVLLDSEKLRYSDAARLIKCVRQVQRRYRVRLEPDFLLDVEIDLFNQGILLDGRALSDAYMFKHDGKVLFGQDFTALFTDPQEVSPPGDRLFAVIKQQFKEWLFHHIARSEVPDWMASWAITTAANVRGFVNIASREESFDAVEKVISGISSFPAYRKFKESAGRGALTADEFMELLGVLKSGKVPLG